MIFYVIKVVPFVIVIVFVVMGGCVAVLLIDSEIGCATDFEFARAHTLNCGSMFFEPQNLVGFCGSELLICLQRPLVSIFVDELLFFDD